MSEQPTAPQPQLPPLVVDVTGADPSDRLAALYAAYPEAKAKADAASETLKAVTDAIKLELTNRAPQGTAKVELRGAGGKPLALRWQVTERFDTTRFRKEQPGVYESYRKASGSWVLAPVKGGE